MPTLAYFCAKCERQLEFEADEQELAQLSVTCPICGQAQVRKLDAYKSPNKNPTGTYRYSKAMNKIVRVSDKVPGLSRGGEGGAEGESCPSCKGGTCEVCEPACGKPPRF